MKKTLFALVLTLWAAHPLWADGPEAAPSPKLYGGLALGLDLPAQNYNPLFNLGWGGRLLAGYHLDQTLSVQLTAENLSFAGGGVSIYDLRLIPQVKAQTDLGGWQAYLVTGPGLDLEFAPGLSVPSFDWMAGPGAQFPLNDGKNLFVEWDLNFIFGNGVTGMDCPVEMGVNFPL